MSSNYANEVFCNIKQTPSKTQTLAIESILSWSKDKPLSMNNLSRLVVTGIEKLPSGEKTICVANIPAEEIPCILDEYAEAMQTESICSVLAKQKPAAQLHNEDNKRAVANLQQTFSMGRNKGKAYWQVPKNELEEYRNFLDVGKAKYPSNVKAIDVINAILALPEEQYQKCIKWIQAHKEDTSAGGSYVIYDSTFKPRQSQKDAEGRWQCYHLVFRYDGKLNYPWVVQLETLYAPVDIKEGGRYAMRLSEAVNKSSISILLNKQDGRKMFRNMERAYNNFSIVTYKAQLKAAAEMEAKAIAERKAAAETPTT